MPKITVLLADDHAVVRQGLRRVLQAEPDIEIVGEAETGRMAVRQAKLLKPDIVVMDIAMPLLNGVEASRQIIKTVSSTRVLVLSCYNDDEYAIQLHEAGAAGYLLKQAAVTDLVKAIREARKGNVFYSPAIARRLIAHYRKAHKSGASRPQANPLTSREAEVLQLIAEGKANKQIAAELDLSIKTVQKHRQRLMDKLDIHDIAGLTRYAVTRGVIQPVAAAA